MLPNSSFCLLYGSLVEYLEWSGKSLLIWRENGEQLFLHWAFSSPIYWRNICYQDSSINIFWAFVGRRFSKRLLKGLEVVKSSLSTYFMTFQVLFKKEIETIYLLFNWLPFVPAFYFMTVQGNATPLTSIWIYFGRFNLAGTSVLASLSLLNQIH